MRPRILIGVLLLVATGCVKLPQAVVNPPAQYNYIDGFSSDSLPRDIAWWQHFGDSLLNRLELQALRANRDLAVAASRVEAARLNRISARAVYLPQLSISGSGAGSYGPQTVIEQQYKLAPAVSWETPLFGAIRSTRERSKAEILGQEWTFRGVVLSLTAEVASTYFSLLGYLREEEIALKSYRTRYASLALTDSLRRYGMATALECEQAAGLLYTASIDRIAYRESAIACYLSLRILLGLGPEELPQAWQGAWLDGVTIPEQVPVGLPSDLLDRRPDVMSSRYGVDQAGAEVGLARAARLPILSLTADGGVISELVKGIKEGDPWFWSGALTLSAPLVGFGRLKVEERMARESYMQALFQYEKTILQAFSDVEQALSGVQLGREQLHLLERLVTTNRRALEKSEALYRNGMSPYLDLLDAERSYYESQMQQVEQQVTLLTHYVNLYQALGGGW